MREIVKVRTVAGSVVVSLPASVLEPVGIKPGDRVLVEASAPNRLIITKEGKSMTSTERLELEIDLLGKKKAANNSEAEYLLARYNDSYATSGFIEEFPLMMKELNRDRDQLEVGIAEKRLALYDLQGIAQGTTQQE